MKVLIIGGVAGGASVASRLRRNSETAEIVMFERSEEIAYANCGIPYHIGNVIKQRDELVLLTPAEFTALFKVDVRIRSEVIAINRSSKTITIQDLPNGHRYEESYDYLVLSPGAAPIKPEIPGINDPRVFTLRSLTDMDALLLFISQNKPRRVAIVGGGFIGLEIAENLHNIGLQINVVELNRQVLGVIDYDSALIIHQHLRSKGVNLYLGQGVKEFKLRESNLLLRLMDDTELMADLVILAIGVKPEINLAISAGLTVGTSGGIDTDEYFRTNDPAIFALGDAIETKLSATQIEALVPLANSAHKAARIVADNICGANRVYEGTPATAIAKIFDLHVAVTGSNEKSLQKTAVSYAKVYLNPLDHAGYYPDAKQLFIKLLYAPEDGAILGAQIIGHAGVDKRIDVISSMMQFKHTVYDLAKLELAYAPPFNSAKDPVNLAGMIAINQIEGKNRVIYNEDLEGSVSNDPLFLDVRPPEIYQREHIAGAINIPLEQLRSRINDLPRDRKIIIYCNQGKTAYFALRILINSGFENVVNLAGGYLLYKGLQDEKKRKNLLEKQKEE